MPKRNDDKSVYDDGEDEDIKDPVVIRDGFSEYEDDDEGNEDLSLKVLEKALSRRDVGNKLDTTSMSDLSDSGVVGTMMVNGGTSKGKNAESSKKMKGIKLEAAHEIPIVCKDQDVDKVVEEVPKGEEEDDEVERSAEPKTGETSSNMVLKKLLRGARYFDPPDAGWVSCYSCGEQGHITVNCPTPTKRRKPCFICGSLEHGAKQCSKGHDCYICKKGGHRAKDCPDKYKSGSKAAVCLRCGDFGHDLMLCKYEYSQEDLKDIQCYVCKNFGHLCCIEPGNSPSWAVSCYRCGQLGHTGLGCGRHHDESTEKDYVSPSCFKCGGEGHFKRDCPNSSSVSFPEIRRESATTCFKCGEEGHISRECSNSSSITTAQGRDSPSLCYKCNGAGHFARECPNSSQVSKRNRDTSTPSHKSHKKKKANLEHNSTPQESNGKSKKKKKKHKEKQPPISPRKPKRRGGWMTEEPEGEPFQRASPRKPKQRGGWMTEEPEEESFRGKMRRPRSPITPSGYNLRPRSHTTHVGHNHKLPTFNSGGHIPGSRSTTPYGRNHRNSSYESSRRLSHSPPTRWQPYYPPSHQHHQHHQHHRYEPPPSRYSGPHHYGAYGGNYERW